MARTDDLVVEEVDGGLVIYDGQTAHAHYLDPSASAVWRACRQPSTETEIVGAAGLDGPTCDSALSQLIDLRLVEADSRSGYSRRVVLRTAAKVGLAGTIAAPVISTLVPAAAAATSGVTPPPPPPTGTDATPGYWFASPVGTQVTQQLLSQYNVYLGTYHVTTLAEAQAIFALMNFSPPDAVDGLAGQLLAVKLDILGGVFVSPPSCLTAAVAAADGFLASIPFVGAQTYNTSYKTLSNQYALPLQNYIANQTC